MVSIYVLYWMGSLVVVGSNKEVKQDYWVCVLIASVFMVPMAFLYYRLIKLYPGKNLFEMLIEIFGRIFGKIMVLLYVFFSLYIGGLVVSTFTLFIKITALPETPLAMTGIFLILISIMASISGPETIGRVSKFLTKFVIGFVYFATLICLNFMKPQNLLPVMNSDFKAILGSSYTLFLLPMAESFICLSFFSTLDKSEKIGKIFFKAIALTMSTFLIVALRNVLVLGQASQLFYYPSYAAISVASIGDFFSRFEILVGVDLVLAGLVKTCVCIYSSSLGLAKAMHLKDQKGLVVPCALIILTWGLLAFERPNQVFDFIPIFTILVTPFEVLLPIVTLIGAEIQHRMKSGGEKNTELKNEEQTN